MHGSQNVISVSVVTREHFWRSVFFRIGLQEGSTLQTPSCPTYYLSQSPLLATLGVWCEEYIPEVTSRPLWQQIIQDIPVSNGMTSLLPTLRGSDEDASLTALSPLLTRLLLGRQTLRCHSLEVLLVRLFLVPLVRLWIFLSFCKSLSLELDIYSSAHHLCKMLIFYEPRRVTLGNTRHFVEE